MTGMSRTVPAGTKGRTASTEVFSAGELLGRGFGPDELRLNLSDFFMRYVILVLRVVIRIEIPGIRPVVEKQTHAVANDFSHIGVDSLQFSQFPTLWYLQGEPKLAGISRRLHLLPPFGNFWLEDEGDRFEPKMYLG